MCIRDRLKGRLSVEEAIHDRISRRRFQDQGLNLAQAGQLLWSAGGLGAAGTAGVSRAAPSAGATYPLELYLAAGDVEGLDAGLYHYDYRAHALEMLQLSLIHILFLYRGAGSPGTPLHL